MAKATAHSTQGRSKMSFRINTNVEALSAFNSVSNVSSNMTKSMGKLSKGLRIADASDDPAGLISSELFRSQITSMDSAMRNNTEAMNFAKTAENALGEMNQLLADARGLAIASGNSATLTATQLAANQDQINSIVTSINRISSSVTYSGRKLLDGSAGVTTQISNTSKVAGFSFGGTANSSTITQTGLITINQTVPYSLPVQPLQVPSALTASASRSPLVPQGQALLQCSTRHPVKLGSLHRLMHRTN
jgi:flagellin